MKILKVSWRPWVASMLVLCLAGTTLRAATIVWTNTAGGSFGTAANWSPNAVPGSGDVAIITNIGTYTVTLDTGRTLGGLQLGAASGGGAQALNMNGNALTLSGGSIVNSDGVLKLSSNLGASGANLTNNGTVTWTAGAIFQGNGAMYNNGLWDAQVDSSLNWDGNGSAAAPTFYNAGTFRKSGGSGTTAFNAGFAFNNTGTLDVQSGTVSLNGGGVNTAAGVFNTANGKTLTFGNTYAFNDGSQFTGLGDMRLVTGTFTLNGNITFTKLTQVGGALAGTHVLNGIFTFSGGSWNSVGATTVANSSTLNITNSINISNRTLTNNGTVTWTAGAIFQGNGAMYNNGLWDAQVDSSLNWDGNGSATAPTFYNAGTFRKSAGGGTTAFNAGFAFNNTGILDVQTGTVNLVGGGANTAPGVFNTASGAALTFNSSYAFNTGSQFTGLGDMRLVTGTFTLNGNITFTKLTQLGGTLAGTHVLNGAFTIGGGSWNSGGATTVANGSTLNITNSVNSSNRTLTNNGTVSWTAGAIFQGNGAMYNNGLWDAQVDSSLNWDGNGSAAAPTFYNAGTFRKSGGSGTTAFNAGFAFNNTGTLDVQTGTVNLLASHNLTGGTVNIGISSLSNFGKVILSGASGFTGNFSANLNGGYIPITNNTFAVITYGSLSGTFGSYALPFANAWTNIYSATTFSLYVLNARPIPPVVTNQIINELTLLTITNTALDLDVPTNTLTYSLLAPPAGAAINSSGIFTWTPDESQGPGTNLIRTVVTDNGTPSLSATNAFTVVINEINLPPVLSPLANTNVDELTTLTLTNSVADSDLPANDLTYTLIEAPAGATIDTNGVITWTPTEAQGPSTNTFTTIVTDTNSWAVNTPSFTVTNTFSVVVNEINVAPLLTVPASTNLDELVAYSAQATAVDPDLPVNALTFSLVSGPAGLTVSPTGAINWTPDESQGATTNLVVVQVTDFNPWAINPQHLSATDSYEIVVNEINRAPVLPAIADTDVNELVTLTITNTATDPDQPANPLTYTLLAAPVGAVIDTNGVITWMPTETQGPGTNIFTTVVTDTNRLAVNANSLSATNTFSVVVNEVNVAPVLTLPADTNINEQVAYTALATAADADLPTNKLTFALVSGPAGLTVSPNGTIHWTPDEAQGPSTNTVFISVTDTNPAAINAKSLSVTNSYQIVVNEVNLAPYFDIFNPAWFPQDPHIVELQPYSFQLVATDNDLPANQIRYELISGPAGLTVSSNGLINWTPTEAQGSGSGVGANYAVQVRAVDDNPQAVNETSLSSGGGFMLFVREVNSAPVLPANADTNLNELTTLIVTNTATDSDLPVNTLTYALLNPPPGAAIDTNGVITWTPTEAQGPSTNIITTVVTDNGTPTLGVTNSFTVVVNEINVAPVLTVPPNTNIDELAAYSGNATATDADIPTNTLTFALVSGPAGLTVSPTGAINWMPSEAQGPSTNTVLISVTDLNPGAVNAISLSTTNSFQIVVTEVNVAPVLAPIADQTVDPGQTVSFTATATDADEPTNTLLFSLVSPPRGAAIDPRSGLFTWRAGAGYADTTNLVQIKVADNGAPSLSDTQTLTLVVNRLAPVVLTPIALTNSHFIFSVNGSAGPDYIIMTSTNLTTWSDVLTNRSPVPPFPFDDANAASRPHNYYRVRLSP